MKILKNKIKDIIVLIGFIVLLVIGSFYDFKFSDKIYQGSKFYNLLIACLAKMPIAGLSVYSFLCLLNISMLKENKSHRICLIVTYFIGAIVSSVLMFEDLSEMFIDNAFRYLIALILGIILILYLLYVLKNEDKNLLKLNKKEYLTIVGSFALIIIIVYALKEFIGRDRFESILIQEGIYTNWYEISDGGESCPSGHVAMIVALFSAIPLFKTFKSYKLKDWLMYCILFIVFIIVSLSRISLGKHYLSDIAIGGIIAFIISKCVTLVLFGINEDKKELREGSIIDKYL